MGGKAFYGVGGQTLAQVAERGWRASSLGDIQNLPEHIPEHIPEQPALATLLQERQGDLQRCLSASVILWLVINYKHKALKCRGSQ